MSQQIYRIHAPLRIIIIMVYIFLSSFSPDCGTCNIYYLKTENSYEKYDDIGAQASSMTKITSSIQRFTSSNDTASLIILTDSLIKTVPYYYSDSIILAEVYYYIGVCKSLTNRFEEAIIWLKSSVDLKLLLGIKDNHYTNGIFNLGVSFNLLGDYNQACIYWLDYIKETETMAIENNSGIAEAYSALVGASIEMKEFDKFTEYTFKVLNILGRHGKALEGIKLSNLYSSIGAGYGRMGDFAKARIYLEKAESIINQGYMIREQDYINLINSMAITYGSLGMSEKATYYFDQGIDLAISNNSFLAYNMINSYVIELGNSGKVEEGEAFLSGLVTKARKYYGNESRYYCEVLKNYAEFLSNFTDELPRSLMLYSECQGYLNKHPEDVILRDQILIGYSIALHKKGEFVKSLEKIQELFFGKEYQAGNNLYKNPGIDSLSVDRRTLRVLQAKYLILWDVYKISGEQKVLEAAANTSELMISLIDKIRINVSEEESRVLMGSSFRESYLQAIRSFELSYRNSGERRFLEKAFEFAEKSKVAGLLASTRELNALQFHIPPKTADMEKVLQKEISLINSRISREIEKGSPDKKIMSSLNEKLLSVIKARDSLVMIFEKDYSGYYSIKYNSSVPSLKEIPLITGRNNNYLNYVMSDSMLYIFIINRKYQKILTCKIDSSFESKILRYRLLLSNPSPSESARTQFIDFQNTGFDLYRMLIEPVRPYLISENLMISPDNLLSYLPFETLLSSGYSGDEILYRKLHYLMNDYSISYVYSATFMKENIARNYSKTKDLIAFAPVYDKAMNTDTLFLKSGAGGILNPLPYSRQEAEYVSQITEGKLYLDNEARESTFKREAGRYDIIHLAMHTFLNDTYPMNSAMLFSRSNDSPEDGLLNTYEVYGIPLKARMVVLSSCKTGYGKLSSGEGILSLARGFLYSGSQSVVLSMWEIEDRSGTDIIKMYYDNLLKGKSKSSALKKARKDYLRKAGQLRSHPYFWSTLLIYGDNSPIYGKNKKFIIIFITLILGVVLIYFLKRRYS